MGFEDVLMNDRCRLISAVLALAVILAVVPARPAVKRNIEISLSKKEIREMNSAGLILAFSLNIANSSSGSFYLAECDYRLVVQGIDVFALKASLEKPIYIQAKKDTLISLPLQIDYAQLLQRVPGIETSPNVGCYVAGLMQFSDGRKIRERVPFAFSGEFPIFHDPEVEVRPLEIKGLSVGGAEFAFVFICKNSNSFDLVLRKVSYRLGLEGNTMVEGVLQGEYFVGSRGEKEFSIPVLLDFFEIGNQFYPILKRPAAECEFSAEVEAGSIWGDLKMAFLKKEKIAISTHGLRHHPHL